MSNSVYDFPVLAPLAKEGVFKSSLSPDSDTLGLSSSSSDFR